MNYLIIAILYYASFFLGAITHEHDIYNQCVKTGMATSTLFIHDKLLCSIDTSK